MASSIPLHALRPLRVIALLLLIQFEISQSIVSIPVTSGIHKPELQQLQQLLLRNLTENRPELLSRPTGSRHIGPIRSSSSLTSTSLGEIRSHHASGGLSVGENTRGRPASDQPHNDLPTETIMINGFSLALPQSAIGRSCQSSNECNPITPNTVCNWLGLCTCMDNFRYNASSRRCVQLKQYGDSCHNHDDCALIDYNLRCGLRNFCVCKRGYYYDYIDRICVYDPHCNWNEFLERCSHQRSASSILENLFFIFLGFMIVMGCCNKPKILGHNVTDGGFRSIADRDIFAGESDQDYARGDEHPATRRLRILFGGGTTPRGAPRDPIGRRLRSRSRSLSERNVLSTPSPSSGSGSDPEASPPPHQSAGHHGALMMTTSRATHGFGPTEYVILLGEGSPRTMRGPPPPPPFSDFLDPTVDKPPPYEEAIKMPAMMMAPGGAEPLPGTSSSSESHLAPIIQSATGSDDTQSRTGDVSSSSDSNNSPPSVESATPNQRTAEFQSMTASRSIPLIHAPTAGASNSGEPCVGFIDTSSQSDNTSGTHEIRRLDPITSCPAASQSSAAPNEA